MPLPSRWPFLEALENIKMSWGFATCNCFRICHKLTKHWRKMVNIKLYQLIFRYLSHIFLSKSLRIYRHKSRVIYLKDWTWSQYFFGHWNKTTRVWVCGYGWVSMPLLLLDNKGLIMWELLELAAVWRKLGSRKQITLIRTKGSWISDLLTAFLLAFSIRSLT